NDDHLRFLKQIGVDYVNVPLDHVQGYKETGCFTKSALRAVIDRLDAVGLRIERANSDGDRYLNAHLGRPEGQKEIDNFKKVAEARIPDLSVQPFLSWQLLSERDRQRLPTGYQFFRDPKRGYRSHAFTLDRARKAAVQPAARVTADQLWKGLVNIYRQLTAVL